MKSSRIVRTAFQALIRNPMRATLTMLGIFIGVGSVIVMMGIGKGSSTAIQRTIASMGANNLMIMPGAATNAGVNLGVSSAMSLTPEDAEAVLNCPSLSAGAPVVRVRAQVLYGNRNWVPRDVIGTTPAYLDVRDWVTLDEGNTFIDSDVRNASKVCLIGRTLVRELFNGESPLGKDVRVQNVSFKVIGVLRSKGSNMMGQDQDDVLLAPWTTIKYRVSVSVNTPSAMASAGAVSVNKINQVYPNGALSLYPPTPISNWPTRPIQS